MKSTKSVARRIGYVLHENESIVVIATMKTTNRKTGKMVQVWILNRHVSPIESVKTGLDSAICFDCSHRGNGFQGRTCYVNLRSPQGIWKAYQRGRYAHITPAEYAAIFDDKKIRFGAYGEPVLIPVSILSALASIAKGWTGYTHQWRKSELQKYRAFLMASCDSAQDAEQAIAMGWRYFRVRSKAQAILPGEINCPASDEAGHKTTCAKCGLCNGARDNDARKNITLLVHGSGAKNFVTIESIVTMA